LKSGGGWWWIARTRHFLFLCHARARARAAAGLVLMVLGSCTVFLLLASKQLKILGLDEKPPPSNDKTS
jgi:hypothetical protein